MQEVLAVPMADRNEGQHAAKNALQRAEPGWSALSKAIATLKKAKPKLQSTLVMRELPQPQPRGRFVSPLGETRRVNHTPRVILLSALLNRDPTS